MKPKEKKSPPSCQSTISSLTMRGVKGDVSNLNSNTDAVN